MLSGLEDIKLKGLRSTKIDCTQVVEEYIDGEDWRIKANANTSYSNAGLVNNLAGKVIANYWLDNVYSNEEGKAHREGDYHIHDLDCLTPYCFTKDTMIKTVEYGDISIGELLILTNNGQKAFTVYSWSKHDNKFVETPAQNLCCTRNDATIMAITFDDGLTVRCTPDHKFLLESGEWVEAQDLTETMNIKTLNYC